MRRYQLGIPTWRAAGGVCAIELAGSGMSSPEMGPQSSSTRARSRSSSRGRFRAPATLPRSLVIEGKDVGEVKRAKDDGRLPMEDHNTRIVVLGTDAAAAQYVAEAPDS